MAKDLTAAVFNNKMSTSVTKKAQRQKKKYEHKFAHDENVSYTMGLADNSVLGPVWGVQEVKMCEAGQQALPSFQDDQGILIGNIRMGFGHYRIAMAIASAARSMGLKPYWFDLLSFQQSTASKVISHLNDLYSLGSRLSQKSEIFNRFYWEPLNSEGFKKLEFNAKDQKVAELFAPLCRALPKNMPFVATHVWPAQAAVHAGMSAVVNVIPDNWPMALHLAEGSLHTVQSPSAYLGYRTLRGMGENDHEILNPMPAKDIQMTGHYVDHEIVSNLEADCALRKARLNEGKARRILLSVGGAGAQLDFFVGLLQAILPEVAKNKAALFLNLGDHKKMWPVLCEKVPNLAQALCHFDDWNEASGFATNAISGEVTGTHVFANHDIFSAVYLTNVLMRAADILITKPSELAFYPVPKLFIKRVGGHEAWGAIRGAELGDGTIECASLPFAIQTLQLMLDEVDLLMLQCDSILKMKKAGIYDGAYQVVKLALERAQLSAKK